MSKTTLAGILGGFLALWGPAVSARLQGQQAPPINTSNAILALAVAAVGKLSQDQNNGNGGTK